MAKLRKFQWAGPITLNGQTPVVTPPSELWLGNWVGNADWKEILQN